ncbi:hypothetical protein [Prosthecobacter sp.]|uniref:phenylacetate--CoA ligase family protein n=1 Tax=Prosthecobacter sp. TaxID=1965333 RepID=UPI001D3444C4|nr:hypothetical protein [Prosthecobacter sp.]MCB1278757.1 phenylacetate--CoA ligase family protein [Prosthecobacter sp.]
MERMMKRQTEGRAFFAMSCIEADVQGEFPPSKPRRFCVDKPGETRPERPCRVVSIRLQPAMAIVFRIRDFFHPLLINRLRCEFERNQWKAPEALADMQEKRLNEILAHSYASVPIYRAKFDAAGLKPSDIRTNEDLKKLPVLSRAEARSAGKALHASRLRGLHPVEYHSSGTSGTPFAMLHDKNANALEFAYYWRHWSWAGYRLGDSFADLGSVYFLTRKSDDIQAWQPLLRRLNLSSHQVSPTNAPLMARELERRDCKILKGVASTVYHLALSMEEAGVRPRPLRGVISTGETLLPHQRALIKDIFGCLIFDSYGHMERTVAVSQCEKGGRHVNSDYGLLEFTNIRPSPDGTTLLAEGLGTGLHNRAMPFIRYETGDTFELFRDPQPCPCGRTFPLVKAIHGRQEECVVTPDGRHLTSLFVLPEFVTGLRETQFVQEKADSLVIRVVTGNEFDANQEEQLKSFTQRLTGPSMRISIARCQRDDLVRARSGKFRTVIPLQSSTADKSPASTSPV